MSKTIFIGNIPYDLSETQLIDIFSEAGQVLSFRLVFDRETGKPKGFGFCTFADHETASSAVRNLNNYDINGRTLRVDFAESDDPAGGLGTTQRRTREDSSAENFKNSSLSSSVETITQIIKSMDPQKLAEVLAYLKVSSKIILEKVMIQNSPEQAALLLNQNPQLAFGVFQALISMNLVDAYSMQRILQANPGTYAPAPVQSQPVPTAPQLAAAQLQEQQQQLLLQLINLTPEQIAQLPPDQQAQVIQLRAQIMQQQQG